MEVTAASRDISCRGRVRHEWFRMVYRSGSWEYFASERAPAGRMRAADRYWSTTGVVADGEYICQHDRGRPVDRVFVVDEVARKLVELQFERAIRDGARVLVVRERDGREIVLPDPRR